MADGFRAHEIHPRKKSRSFTTQKIKMKEYEMVEKNWKEMTTEELGKNIEKTKKESAKKLEKLEQKIKKYEKEIDKLKNQVKSAIASNKKKIKKSLKKK
ncbi:MAG: hypothetical protein ACI8ZB_005309 [Desulforhopalus sp.]|jgi:uncharacterized protein Yka (UPF0111/DUF47 family)